MIMAVEVLKVLDGGLNEVKMSSMQIRREVSFVKVLKDIQMLHHLFKITVASN
jgi:hypothetical protein